MKYLKTYEEHTPVEFVAPEEQHSSYKNTIRRRKKQKNGSHLEDDEINMLDPVMVPPNHTKDVISFKRSG
jgi:hypothetical protein